ncbi:hypothetical protein [Pseudoduganella sp. OTU4001]|uniref:hypothetical protein n=1 Tax=Pseudoduganella sp. OTU4001 TaxID=3043854 RepID=UPI00313B5CF2
MKLEIDYQLTGKGWADCVISVEDKRCEISASYLSNALRNLILAANGALTGFNSVSFGFDEEPGEYRWVLISPRPNEIEVEIIEFQELCGWKPNSEGESLLKFRCQPIDFAKAVQSAAAKLLETHGENGYLEMWVEHPFPMSLYVDLTKMIEQDWRNG